MPIHPALVHLPIGLALVSPLVLAALAVALWRGAVSRRAWLAAVALQALVLAGGGAAYLAGEREEDRVERVAPEAPLEAHEQRAGAFLWVAGGVLAASLVALAVPAAAAPAVAALAAAGALATAGLALWTGRAGGELVYVHGAASAYAGGVGPDAAGPATAGRERREGRNRRGHDDD